MITLGILRTVRPFYYIGMFGNIIIALFLKDTVFITRTVIRLTMTSLIFRLFTELSTKNYTDGCSQMRNGNGREIIYVLRLFLRQRNGIVQKKE